MEDREFIHILRRMLYNFVPSDVYWKVASYPRGSSLIIIGRTPESYGFFSESPENVYEWMVRNPNSLQIFHEPDRVLEVMGALVMERKMSGL